MRTAYTTLTDTGNAVDKNLADQKAAADSYNSLSASLTKQYNEANDALTKYNDAKDGFENYDTKMQREGYRMVGGDEGSPGQYAKYVGGTYRTVPDGEGGTYQQFVPDGSVKDDEGNPTGKWEFAPTKDQFLDQANKYAADANSKINAYNEAYKTGTEQLAAYKTTLTDLQAKQPELENAFITQKQTLDSTLADYTAQEKANAEYISKTINDVADARSLIKDQLGADLNDEQIAAFVKTGDVANAAKDYIDLKTTDLGEAQAAAIKEGYYFDPNDPELAKQFLGVKDEADTLAALQQFADARATTVQEATDLYRQTYADIYGPDAQVPDPTSEDLLAFMPAIPTDVSGIPQGYQNVAEDVVKGRIQDQFSQDLGFDSYADRTDAQQALGEERPDAMTWQDYGKTSGIVGTGGDIFQTGVKPGEDVADTRDFITPDQIFGFGEDQLPADQLAQQPPAPSDYGPFQPEQPLDTTVAQTQPDQFGFDLGADVVGPPTPTDLGAPADTGMADLGLDTTTEGTTTTAQADTSLVNPDFTQQAQDFDVSKYLGTQPAGQDVGNIGIQTAAYSPLTTMTDTGAPTDVGLRSLLTQQEGGTSATADDTKKVPTTLAEQNLATDESQQDQAQGTDTKVADSTLTTGAPAGTITSKVFGDSADQDVPSDSLTSKYFSDDKKEGVDDVTSEFKYGTPGPTDQLLQGSLTGANRDQLDSFLSPLRTTSTSLTTDQNAPNTNAATQGLNMDDYDNYDWASWDRAVEDYVNQYDASKTQGGDDVDTSYLGNLSADERARYDRMMAGEDSGLGDLPVQDLGISQQSMDEFNQNFNPPGGFSSGWQTVGSDRVMVNDDGTGIGMNENGDSYALTKEQVDAMIKNGLLNTAGSGYVAATGGTGNTPGGTKPTVTPKTPSTTGSKIVDKLIDAATTPKVLAALGGAALGAAGAPKGMTPMGLRSIETGGSKQLTQTGAKGTKGRGGVQYFTKKAAGGSIDGYAGGGGLGYLKSAHDGMADKIDATIDNKRPAKLSGGEFVIPADVVSHLGNGNSEAGAKQLYDLMERVRKARTGNSDQGKQINPKKYLPR